MNIVWLGDQGCATSTAVGGKAANLSLLAARYPVPPGFSIPTDLLSSWLGGDLDGTRHGPEALRVVREAYQRLGERCGRPQPAVAVRSSAIGEDGLGASFAGQYETYLHITGADAVWDAIVRCWESARSARVEAYQKRRGAATAAGQIAVLVQAMVLSDVSFIAFSADPVTRDRDQVVVNAAWGLGESLVGGLVTPDTFRVRKSDLAVIETRPAEKTQMTVISGGGTAVATVPRMLRTRPCLEERQAQAIAEMAVSLETHMGWPVDTEGAFHQGKLYLLQCRPITTI